MARDLYIASSVENAPGVGHQNTFHYYAGQHDYNSIVNQPLSNFVPKKAEPEESKKRTWEICNEMDQKLRSEGGERKRRLVSLFEANEVSKRVTGMKRYGGYQVVVNGGLVDTQPTPDVFSEWM